MALTWGDSGNWVKMTAANDAIRGDQRVKKIRWYATGATAGTTLMLLNETKGGAPLCEAVAEAAQFTKDYEAPSGIIQGLTLATITGHIVVFFEERLGISPKKLHDETEAAAE
ncbi:MAG: hypothetical protein LLG08_10120 [Actinomycetia bacterium]|nr:hypothetical protein [Actinomycetes bacterium]